MTRSLTEAAHRKKRQLPSGPASHTDLQAFLCPHEAAAIFPMLAEDDLAKLTEDIRVNGLCDPIVVHEGQILDGRNRYEACRRAGVNPTTTPFAGKDPVAFVLSKNLHRRQLTESQRAMVAARIANMRHGENQYAKEGRSRDLSSAVAQPEAAARCNVSVPSLKRAAVVIRDGDPELVGAVERGEVTVASAATLAKIPKPKQREALQGKKVASTIRLIRKTAQKGVSRTRKHLELVPPPAVPELDDVVDDDESEAAVIRARSLPFDEFHARTIQSWLAVMLLELIQMTPPDEAEEIASILFSWSRRFEKRMAV